MLRVVTAVKANLDAASKNLWCLLIFSTQWLSETSAHRLGHLQVISTDRNYRDQHSWNEALPMRMVANVSSSFRYCWNADRSHRYRAEGIPPSSKRHE